MDDGNFVAAHNSTLQVSLNSPDKTCQVGSHFRSISGEKISATDIMAKDETKTRECSDLGNMVDSMTMSDAANKKRSGSSGTIARVRSAASETTNAHGEQKTSSLADQKMLGLKSDTSRSETSVSFPQSNVNSVHEIMAFNNEPIETADQMMPTSNHMTPIRDCVLNEYDSDKSLAHITLNEDDIAERSIEEVPVAEATSIVNETVPTIPNDAEKSIEEVPVAEATSIVNETVPIDAERCSDAVSDAETTPIVNKTVPKIPIEHITSTNSEHNSALRNDSQTIANIVDTNTTPKNRINTVELPIAIAETEIVDSEDAKTNDKEKNIGAAKLDDIVLLERSSFRSSQSQLKIQVSDVDATKAPVVKAAAKTQNNSEKLCVVQRDSVTDKLKVSSRSSRASPKLQKLDSFIVSASRMSDMLNKITRRPDNEKSISDKNHPEFELTCDMMLGIRHAVGQQRGMDKKFKATKESFREVKSYRFPQEGSATTPGHAMRSFKFKDYQPDIFRSLRVRWGIDTADYLLCLCGDEHYLEFISNSKSGQFFFYSHDRQFMIKTLTREESLLLRRIMSDYYQFVMQYPDTLMTRFYGLHRVKPHKGRKMHFVIMASVFYTDRFIHEVYDIKGSTHGRKATDKEREQDTPVLKDLDFIDQKVTIQIGKTKGLQLITQLQEDVRFLEKLKIMDYSLLLGIHYTKKAKGELKERSQNEGESSTSDENMQRNHRRRQSNYGLKSWQQVIASSLVKFDDDLALYNENSLKPRKFGRSSTFDSQAGAKLSTFCLDSGGCRAIENEQESNRIYFMGIIDILQLYNNKKRLENRWKAMKFDKNTISAVRPKVYANRFIEFLKLAIEHELPKPDSDS